MTGDPTSDRSFGREWRVRGRRRFAEIHAAIRSKHSGLFDGADVVLEYVGGSVSDLETLVGRTAFFGERVSCGSTRP